MASEVQEKLLNFISQHYCIPKDEIDPHKSLVDQGVIDSFGFVEIVLFLEKEFSMAVTDKQINSENFGCVTRIVDFVSAASQAAFDPSEPPLAE